MEHEVSGIAFQTLPESQTWTDVMSIMQALCMKLVSLLFAGLLEVSLALLTMSSSMGIPQHSSGLQSQLEQAAPSSRKATSRAMGRLVQRQADQSVTGSRVSQIIMKRLVCLHESRGRHSSKGHIQ
jgi:hypothetical protein